MSIRINNIEKIMGSIVILTAITCGNMAFSKVNAAKLKPNVAAKSAVVINKKNGKVLASKNEHSRYHALSCSKLIVIYMVEKDIKAGKLKRNQVITIPTQYSGVNNTIKMMTGGQKYTVEQLEKATLLPSSNIAAMTLAKAVAGSQQNYYKKADKLLADWGIKNANLSTVTGGQNGELAGATNNKISPYAENELSAYDLGAVGYHLVKDFPEITKITSLPTAVISDTEGQSEEVTNLNKLLGNTEYNFVGLKTGSDDSVSNFVGYAKVNKNPVVTVVMGSPSDGAFNDTTSLLDQIKQNNE